MPMLSVGIDAHYQRWLDGPVAVQKNSELVDNFTIAVGPRLHIPLGSSTWVRPGVAYARGTSQSLASPNYHIVQLDVPVAF
jgi:hypothetical protein